MCVCVCVCVCACSCVSFRMFYCTSTRSGMTCERSSQDAGHMLHSRGRCSLKTRMKCPVFTRAHKGANVPSARCSGLYSWCPTAAVNTFVSSASEVPSTSTTLVVAFGMAVGSVAVRRSVVGSARVVDLVGWLTSGRRLTYVVRHSHTGQQQWRASVWAKCTLLQESVGDARPRAQATPAQRGLS
jgi:hypothetical protein